MIIEEVFIVLRILAAVIVAVIPIIVVVRII
jgi:hypothetical protein